MAKAIKKAVKKVLVDPNGNVIKRKPGRPKKDTPVLTEVFVNENGQVKRKVGRPKKNSIDLKTADLSEIEKNKPEAFESTDKVVKQPSLEEENKDKEEVKETNNTNVNAETSIEKETKQTQDQTDSSKEETSEVENYVSSENNLKTEVVKEDLASKNTEETETKLFQKNFDYSNAKELLRVKHLKQYFRFKGPVKYIKAVHDVSFTVYKGEVFGLVGESGCGKSTTGRDILKLYKITSGDIWLDGVRIAAGTRWNEKEIKYTNIRLAAALREAKNKYKNELDALQSEYSTNFDESFKPSTIEKLVKQAKEDDLNADKDLSDKVKYLERYTKLAEDYKLKVKELKEKAKGICSVQREEIKKAKYDDKNYQKKLRKIAVDDVNSKYSEFLGVYKNDQDNIYNKINELKTKFHEITNQEFNEGKVNKALQEGNLSSDLEETYKQTLADYQTLNNQLNDINIKYKEYLAEVKKAKKVNLANKVQMIFQDPIASLNPRMTVRNIIAEGLIIQGIHDKKYINSEVERVLKLVGLVPEHANRYPHEFSGGQRQRIGIARAIIMKPELIVADEPVSALDVSIQAQVINLLNDLRNNLGLTLIFIAHNLSVVKYFCDRIAVMYYGNLVELATADELFAHPLHPYTKSLLSAVPYPDPNIEAQRKRIIYNPSEAHDYSKQKPTMRELEKGHFVLCNDEEEKKYLEELKSSKSIYARN